MTDYIRFLNRTACDVLEEARNAIKTLNFSSLPSLIEELQAMFNKMEAALGDKKDIERMTEDHYSLKKEIKKLVKERDSLTKEIDEKD